MFEVIMRFRNGREDERHRHYEQNDAWARYMSYCSLWGLENIDEIEIRQGANVMARLSHEQGRTRFRQVGE